MRLAVGPDLHPATQTRSTMEGKIMTENSSAETAERPRWVPSEPFRWTQLMGKLDAIVSSKPEGHTYVRQTPGGSCCYWHSATDEPGCLIGQLMHTLGVPADLLKVCDSNPRGGTISNVAQYLVEGLFDEQAVAVLGHIQSQQDNGETWAQAVVQGHAFAAGIFWAQSDAKRKAREAGGA